MIQDDPADNKFLECALGGRAGFVVGGDEHLLREKRYRRMWIVSAGQFLKLLEDGKGRPTSEGKPGLQK